MVKIASGARKSKFVVQIVQVVVVIVVVAAAKIKRIKRLHILQKCNVIVTGALTKVKKINMHRGNAQNKRLNFIAYNKKQKMIQ